jgi:hypothetical protein
VFEELQHDCVVLNGRKCVLEELQHDPVVLMGEVSVCGLNNVVHKDGL